jgi:hypothetical protein
MPIGPGRSESARIRSRVADRACPYFRSCRIASRYYCTPKQTTRVSLHWILAHKKPANRIVVAYLAKWGSAFMIPSALWEPKSFRGTGERGHEIPLWTAVHGLS